ncbi:MAG: hypothetical protein FWC97_01920, partial [Treponema sp.]|nr:hypothetical protein [Treponema sp.]
MMNKNYKVAAFFLFLLSLSFVNAVQAFSGEVEFNIRFFDRRIYYVSDEPIFIQVTITNNTPEPFRFRLADDRAFSIEFETRTMTNRPLPQADSLIQRRTSSRQVFFREISIDTKESFSFIEDLRDFIRIDNPGSYRVRAFIHPELINAAASTPRTPITSNTLTLSVRPPAIPGPDGLPIQMDIDTGAALVRQPLPPDQVVAFMITARQQSQWERFFLYLDLEAMFTRDPHQRRRYLAENEAGRRRLMAEYRQNLQSAVVDSYIVLIPTSFDILRTEHSQNEGVVTVMQRFRHANHTELRLYRYFLERRDN